MKGLHKYVMKNSYQLTYHLPEGGDCVATEDCFHRTLFGGDQLTVSRSRSAQSARCNDDVTEERFGGLIPITEDWHARMTLMRVRVVLMNAACILYRFIGNLEALISRRSSTERGTLYQLKNLINRSGVPADPGDNMKAVEDFLVVVLHSHVVTAANAIPCGAGATDVDSLSKSIVDCFVHINAPSALPPLDDCIDKVCLYAMEVLTLGLLWHNFHDSIREGDGDHILRM